MLKRIVKLLKTMFSDVFTKTETVYNDKRSPVLMLESIIAKAKAEREKMEVRYRDSETQLAYHERIISEKEKESKNLIEKAKIYKESGDNSSANRTLTLALKIEDWVDRYKGSADDLRANSAAIFDVAQELSHKIDSCKIDLDLIKSSSSIANGKLEQYDNIGYEMENIDEILKEANERVAAMNDRVVASEKTSETFRPRDKSKDAEMDGRVKEMFDKL